MRDLIAQWLPLFFSPDDVFEVRVLNLGKPGRTVAGWFRARDIPARAAVIAEAAEQITDGGGVYFTPNPVRPECYRRRANVLGPVLRDKRTGEVRPRLTHDEDVLGRRWLLIDVDPVRAADGRGQSATEGEKAAAWAVAQTVRGLLPGEQPLVIDSGNGYHLYYPLTPPLPGGAADAATDPAAVALRVIAAKADSQAAKVDVAVCNAARLMKLPGSWSRKGEHTPGRPHRQSRVLEIPAWASTSPK